MITAQSLKAAEARAEVIFTRLRYHRVCNEGEYYCYRCELIFGVVQRFRIEINGVSIYSLCQTCWEDYHPTENTRYERVRLAYNWLEKNDLKLDEKAANQLIQFANLPYKLNDVVKFEYANQERWGNNIEIVKTEAKILRFVGLYHDMDQLGHPLKLWVMAQRLKKETDPYGGNIEIGSIAIEDKSHVGV